MRYIGSKSASLTAIAATIRTAGIECRILCDPFAGTCTVPRYFKSLGCKVITGDVLTQSYAFQVAYLNLNRTPSFARVLSHEIEKGAWRRRDLNGLWGHRAVLKILNDLPGRRGFVTSNYSPVGPARRRFFTPRNAMQIDAARERIATWQRSGLLSEQENYYLLASLLEALDRVANTAGTYYAYLKSWYRKALKPLHLDPLSIQNNSQKNIAHRTDAEALVQSIESDVLYLDPPYNERPYGSYYHLPETVALGDQPAVRGMCGMPIRNSIASDFYHRDTASAAMRRIVETARAKLILVHYAADGLVEHRDLVRILKHRGQTWWAWRRVRKYSGRPGTPAIAGHRIYSCLTK